ncbi:MAG: Sulfotransferase domain protein [Candidatus Scalindua rubra]|uniref:Sulfotransferase domain protein n=1 Tax=Candidatus Scalindua rubra TaxID=1872076 RepID=A0A1E3X4L3_9BACT|nr:MAG: Sulfotransferase domain protein [Candidatus Scalindua rubra]
MKDPNNSHILVTGMQRSGTTFTSSILSTSPELVYIPEPFNPNYGLKGVDSHYSYLDIRNEHEKTIQLLNDLFSYKAKYKKNYTRDNLLKIIVKFFLGPRAQIRYRMSGFFRKGDARFLIKDPDAAFLSEDMYLKHNCQILIMVRHPCAVLSSYKRLGWGFDFETFLTREHLMENHLKDFETLFRKKDKSLAEQVGLLWASVYRVLRTYSARQDNWLTILHEDICNNPEEMFRNIFKWAGICMTETIRHKIDKYTSGVNPITARGNKLHDFSRDSMNLATYWKEVITPEERAIVREITEPVSSLYYDSTSWD